MEYTDYNNLRRIYKGAVHKDVDSVYRNHKRVQEPRGIDTVTIPSLRDREGGY